MSRAWEFSLRLGRADGDNGLRFGSGFGRRARVLGPAGFAVGALFRLCRRFFHIINFTAVSVRARWKKGQEEQPKGNCFPSLVSQFMLGKWFSGQHYSRTTTGELGDTDRSCSDVTFSPLSSQDVMTSPRGHVVCHVFLFLLGSFFVIVRRR